MGYMYDELGTRKAIDSAGWLHTGDVGYIDSDGFLFITGRIKGITVTMGNIKINTTINVENWEAF